MLMSHRPPRLFASSSHMGLMPFLNREKSDPWRSSLAGLMWLYRLEHNARRVTRERRKCVGDTPPKVLDCLERSYLFLVLLPGVVAHVLVIPQRPAILQRMLDGIVDGDIGDFVALFFVFFVLKLEIHLAMYWVLQYGFRISFCSSAARTLFDSLVNVKRLELNI